MKKLYGVITAMTTPFDEQGKVDLDAIRKQTEFLIQKGVNCLYPCGTTGEMFLMSVEERKAIAQAVVEQAAGRVVVYIHVGCMNTADTIELAQYAHSIGADGIGVVTPAFFHYTEEALVEHFCAVANSVPQDFPMYLYGIPQFAVADISVNMAKQVLDRCSNVVGIKYSFADWRKVQEMILLAPGRFDVVVGMDSMFYEALCMGAVGTVSGCSCCFPEPFVEIYRLFRAGDYQAARTKQEDAFRLASTLQMGADMAIFKAAQSMRGVPGGKMRAPLPELSQQQLAQLKEQLVHYLT